MNRHIRVIRANLNDEADIIRFEDEINNILSVNKEHVDINTHTENGHLVAVLKFGFFIIPAISHDDDYGDDDYGEINWNLD